MLLDMQGLSLCSTHIHDSLSMAFSSPWKGFPQLRLLRVDWMRNVTWKALQPLRYRPLTLPAVQGLQHSVFLLCQCMSTCSLKYGSTGSISFWCHFTVCLLYWIYLDHSWSLGMHAG